MSKFDFCVFIGRFSPFHNAHKAIIDEALKIAERVIVVIGSAASARNTRNPWSADERKQMIWSSFGDQDRDKIIFLPMRDYLYNDYVWITALQEKVNSLTNYSQSVALIGFESDETSFYLKLFPQYKYISFNTEYNFHATKIRDLYFSRDASYKKFVPNEVSEFLTSFEKAKEFADLKSEKDYIDAYKEQWRGAPFPPIFTTVDAVVIKSGHILLVRRKFNPGKGLFALPGGFLNKNERIQDSTLRELKEETGIKINVPDLRKSIKETRVFDDPQRSSRGRTITHASLFDLGVGDLPSVKGGDDADKAFWLPVSELHSLEDNFFEDHYHIIRYFISKY